MVVGVIFLSSNTPFKSIRITSDFLFGALISVDEMKEFMSLPKQLLWNRFLPNHAGQQRLESWGIGNDNTLICIDER